MSSLVPLALAVVGAPVTITVPVAIARHPVERHAAAQDAQQVDTQAVD